MYLAGRPPLGYDVLSLDVGITPSAQGVPGALEHATPVKPVHRQAVTCTALSLISAPGLAICEAVYALGVMLACCAALWSALRGWWRECVSRTGMSL